MKHDQIVRTSVASCRATGMSDNEEYARGHEHDSAASTPVWAASRAGSMTGGPMTTGAAPVAGVAIHG